MSIRKLTRDREDGFRLLPELHELLRVVNKPKVRELYMLLFLSKCRLDKTLKNKLANRIAGIAAMQNRGFGKRFSPEPDAAWRAIPMDCLAAGTFPRLKELQIKPAQALERILALASDPSRLGPDMTERVYDFTREILQAPTPCGREEMLRMIDVFVRGPRDVPFFTIAGGPGTGKSTIVAAYLRRRKMKGVEHPHFLVDREQGERARTYRILEHLARCVNPAFVAGLSSPVPVDDRQAEELFQKALQPFTGERKSKRTVIFVDGLDETEAGEYSQSSIAAALRRLHLPPGVRFVLASRPTKDFRKLAGTFDIDLDNNSSQNEAIRHYFQARFDGNAAARIDIDRLMEKTNRSFLYARLAAKDIVQALSEHESYDVERMPEGLDEYLETEWERATAGPNPDQGAVPKLLAVIAAHRGAPTLDDLADFTGIAVTEVQGFIGAHQHLFNIEHSADGRLHPSTRIRGYWHSEIQRHFVENHIGKSGMRNAHQAILDAYHRKCPDEGMAQRTQRRLLLREPHCSFEPC